MVIALPCRTDAVEYGQPRPPFMPIHVDFFHPSRLIIVVVRGGFTADEVRSTLQQVLASDVLHYRKIIDIASPTSPLGTADVEALARLVLAQRTDKPRGALAFVIAPGPAAERAELFVKLTEAERPVKVFHSLHEARKWLDENSRPATTG